ncbi:hypothetical protein M011DRAFT_396980 [Sporormia fimetaria CBS 119925]|uniref:Uncharacterized protein n=1 Tax=Sporormia fimetaria CBS 119925 TaxID=1340428 RepID=A0A6A6VLC3_9PLEO|nr:hypothetical protein M011DRAFT_396980 [Sporormia fimetaria CBS 119925]
MVSVHYDGQLQKQFEVLVRGIGTARNLLRKGKMAAKAQELAELAGSEDDEESDDDIQNHIRAKIEFRRRTGLSTMRAPQTMRTSEPPSTDVRPPESLFNSTDKLLEQTQVFCERAAHRVLREGECQKELASMRTNFQEVLEIATREAAKHRAHRKDNELKRKSAEVLKELAVVTVVTHEAKPAAPVIRSIQPMSTTNGLEIEIDDDDGDDNFVLPPIRLTSRA